MRERLYCLLVLLANHIQPPKRCLRLPEFAGKIEFPRQSAGFLQTSLSPLVSALRRGEDCLRACCAEVAPFVCPEAFLKGRERPCCLFAQTSA